MAEIEFPRTLDHLFCTVFPPPTRNHNLWIRCSTNRPGDDTIHYGIDRHGESILTRNGELFQRDIALQGREGFTGLPYNTEHELDVPSTLFPAGTRWAEQVEVNKGNVGRIAASENGIFVDGYPVLRVRGPEQQGGEPVVLVETIKEGRLVPASLQGFGYRPRAWEAANEEHEPYAIFTGNVAPVAMGFVFPDVGATQRAERSKFEIPIPQMSPYRENILITGQDEGEGEIIKRGGES